MHELTVLFVCALVVQLSLHVWLARRQILYVLRHGADVPAPFADAVTPAEHARAAEYAAARQRISIVESLLDAAVLLWLTLGGGVSLFGALSARLPLPGIAAGTVHVLLVFGTVALIGLPLRVYRTFDLEQRFGFNRTTPGMFVSDTLKALGLGLVIGAPATAAVLAIMAGTGERWWLVAWAFWAGFSLLMTLAWPRLIAPLFNRYSPLEDASLRRRIDALLARCGFAVERVFVVDGSRRTAHGNAYFTGLGRHKRIVFFDTLLGTLTHPQVESVLAHELAHFKLGHVPQRLVAGALMSLAGFALLGWLARQPWFHTAFGVTQPTDAATLLLFVLVTPVFGWILAPALTAWSRRQEYQADAFAARHASAPDLADALVRLYRDNASTLTPDPVYSAFHDSHPPPAARIRRLRSSPAPSAAPGVAP